MNFLEAAEVIAFELNKDSWKATADCGVVEWTNEDGERFRIIVEGLEEGEDA